MYGHAHIGIISIGDVPPAFLERIRDSVEVTTRILDEAGGCLSADIPKTIKVYATAELFAQGLLDEGIVRDKIEALRLAAQHGGIAPPEKRTLVMINLSRYVRPFEALAGLTAHELTHVCQYELARYQLKAARWWLVEGSADIVAALVSEQLKIRMYADSIASAQYDVAFYPWRAFGSPMPPTLTALSPARAFSDAAYRYGFTHIYNLADLATDRLFKRSDGLKSFRAYFAAFGTESPRRRR